MVFEAGGESPTVDIIKGVVEYPFIFHVVNSKAAIRGDTE
jgi:hypothetical protein